MSANRLEKSSDPDVVVVVVVVDVVDLEVRFEPAPAAWMTASAETPATASSSTRSSMSSGASTVGTPAARAQFLFSSGHGPHNHRNRLMGHLCLANRAVDLAMAGPAGGEGESCRQDECDTGQQAQSPGGVRSRLDRGHDGIQW
jgi:hypothetical protein